MRRYLSGLLRLLRKKPSQVTHWQDIIASQYQDWLKVNGPQWQNKHTTGANIPLDVVIVGGTSDEKLVPVGNIPLGYRLTTIDNVSSEYIVLLSPGTTLWKDASTRIQEAIKSSPTADLIYFDSEILERKTGKRLPFFKPDYSPDMLLSVPYFGFPLIVRASLLKIVRPIDPTSSVFAWDLALQLVEKTSAIAHITTITATEACVAIDESGWMVVGSAWKQAAKKIVQKALLRRGLNASVSTGTVGASVQISYVPTGKLVTIVISTKDRANLLKQCVDGILANNDYSNWELIIIDNNSTEPETFSYFKLLKADKRIRVLKYPKPFNIAAIFNLAVTKARGEYICFMGNDTQPITHDWLSRMVGYMQRPEIGIVGAKLLYPTNTIQHCGVVLGYGSAPDNSDRVAGHPYSQFPQMPGYFGTINLQRNFSAVTGAVTLTRKKLYQEVGGYDAERLRMLFNDVDYCLKVREKGYFVAYAPEVLLYHHERASLGEVNVNFHIDPNEIRYMRARWQHWEDNDPFYNPNLTLNKQDFSLR